MVFLWLLMNGDAPRGPRREVHAYSWPFPGKRATTRWILALTSIPESPFTSWRCAVSCDRNFYQPLARRQCYEWECLEGDSGSSQPSPLLLLSSSNIGPYKSPAPCSSVFSRVQWVSERPAHPSPVSVPTEVETARWLQTTD